MSNPIKDRYYDLIRQTFNEANELMVRKAVDYEDDRFPIRTFRLSKDLGIEPWKGCLLRMGDKLSLLYTHVRDGKYGAHPEDLPETLLDVIIYAALTRVLYTMSEDLPALSMDQLLTQLQAECQAGDSKK